jgi:Flp pilus assembly pilin Flp
MNEPTGERMKRSTDGRLGKLWSEDQGQDIAEYSIMLAVVLVIVVGTVRLIGSNAGNIFSQVGSAIQ